MIFGTNVSHSQNQVSDENEFPKNGEPFANITELVSESTERGTESEPTVKTIDIIWEPNEQKDNEPKTETETIKHDLIDLIRNQSVDSTPSEDPTTTSTELMEQNENNPNKTENFPSWWPTWWAEPQPSSVPLRPMPIWSDSAQVRENSTSTAVAEEVQKNTTLETLTTLINQTNGKLRLPINKWKSRPPPQKYSKPLNQFSNLKIESKTTNTSTTTTVAINTETEDKVKDRDLLTEPSNPIIENIDTLLSEPINPFQRPVITSSSVRKLSKGVESQEKSKLSKTIFKRPAELVLKPIQKTGSMFFPSELTDDVEQRDHQAENGNQDDKLNVVSRFLEKLIDNNFTINIVIKQ